MGSSLGPLAILRRNTLRASPWFYSGTRARAAGEKSQQRIWQCFGWPRGYGRAVRASRRSATQRRPSSWQRPRLPVPVTSSHGGRPRSIPLQCRRTPMPGGAYRALEARQLEARTEPPCADDIASKRMSEGLAREMRGRTRSTCAPRSAPSRKRVRSRASSACAMCRTFSTRITWASSKARSPMRASSAECASLLTMRYRPICS